MTDIVLQLAQTANLWPLGAVYYNMGGTNSPTGHRPDCSGGVSMRVGLPAPGGNTVSMVTGGSMYEIPNADMRVGDAMGECGPNTEGANGHVQLIEALDGGGGIQLWEQTPSWGPKRRWIYGGKPERGYKTYRFAHAEWPSPEDEDMRTDAFLIQDAHSIAVVWPTDWGYRLTDAGPMLDALMASGVPGPFAVASVPNCAMNALTAWDQYIDAIRSNDAHAYSPGTHRDDPATNPRGHRWPRWWSRRHPDDVDGDGVPDVLEGVSQ